MWKTHEPIKSADTLAIDAWILLLKTAGSSALDADGVGGRTGLR